MDTDTEVDTTAMDTGSAVVGKGSASLGASAYLRRVTEALTRAGEDGYVLRVEVHKVWTMDSKRGNGAVLVGTAQGELADVTLDADENVVGVKPRKQVPHGIAQILIDAVKDNT